MVRKSEEIAEPKAVEGPRVKKDTGLEDRVTELEGDIQRLADLMGKVWGEPMASAAMAIAKKRQGKS